MDLFLIRHAHAVDGDGMRDDDRPLSKDGRKQALDIGGALARQKVRFARIVASPQVRAVETAELVSVSIGYDGGLDVHDAMRPDGSWKHLLREVLEPHGHDAPLALVGHEPTIGHYLSKLLHQKGLSMGKGAVVRLDWQDAERPANVVWTLSPKRLDPSPSL
ncbi:MAG TPA: phosphoglycerate mutase family protein [Polyangia bacterium]